MRSVVVKLVLYRSGRLSALNRGGCIRKILESSISDKVVGTDRAYHQIALEISRFSSLRTNSAPVPASPSTLHFPFRRRFHACHIRWRNRTPLLRASKMGWHGQFSLLFRIDSKCGTNPYFLPFPISTQPPPSHKLRHNIHIRLTS